MSRLIVANWKENPIEPVVAFSLADGVFAASSGEGVTVVVCPPLPYLAPIHTAHPALILGAQDISAQPPGAHTGEVDAEILKNFGVKYAIIGHSERRALGETDAEIAAKVTAASAAGIMPIVCIGESKEINAQGADAVHAFLSKQLDAIPTVPEIVIAYEPIWAIGSGTADDPASAAATAKFIAEYIAPRISRCRVLYGGSSTPENAASFLEKPEINGLLVGGSSLDVGKFTAIVRA